MPQSNLQIIFTKIRSLYVLRKMAFFSSSNKKKAYLLCSGCSADPKITLYGFSRMIGEGG